jgi:glutaredoxin/glutathione-dependent peroxiredoxin
MIAVGSPSPAGVVDIVEPVNGEYVIKAGQAFGDILNAHKKAVIFGVPGAFTPVCSEKHLPGFIERAYAFENADVEAMYCLSVNDLFVMKSWGKATEGFADSNIKLVADGNGDFTRALGMEIDLTALRLGLRCKRFAAIIENGVFTSIEVDEDVLSLDKASAESMLAILRKK